MGQAGQSVYSGQLGQVACKSSGSGRLDGSAGSGGSGERGRTKRSGRLGEGQISKVRVSDRSRMSGLPGR